MKVVLIGEEKPKYADRDIIRRTQCGGGAKMPGNVDESRLYTCIITQGVLERLYPDQLSHIHSICGGPYEKLDDPSREKTCADFVAPPLTRHLIS